VQVRAGSGARCTGSRPWRTSTRTAGTAGFDGVVARVGGSRGGTFEQADGADRAATWELDVGHTARRVRSALPFLRAADGGSVVLVGSISGWKPGRPALYGAAKRALIHLAASLARELGPDRIRVNAVSPGSMLIPGRRRDRMRREDPPAYENFAAAELPTGAPRHSARGGAHGGVPALRLGDRCLWRPPARGPGPERALA
jgi:NAD(P)-dependent dehydrogenase (short-subunit alcohol dehydrogenase family)